jgi:hypothetical protein
MNAYSKGMLQQALELGNLGSSFEESKRVIEETIVDRGL